MDPVYETVENEDGTKSQKLVKDGYYGWVEYDPDNKELNYTVSTTNGTLNIDYALLEGVSITFRKRRRQMDIRWIPIFM